MWGFVWGTFRAAGGRLQTGKFKQTLANKDLPSAVSSPSIQQRESGALGRANVHRIETKKSFTESEKSVTDKELYRTTPVLGSRSCKKTSQSQLRWAIAQTS